MVEKKQDLSLVSYTLGILSVVLAFFTPTAGLVLGIIGFIQSKNEKSGLGKKAKKLNLIGIILSVILVIVSILAITLFGDLINQI